jgi:hypothetical protein
MLIIVRANVCSPQSAGASNDFTSATRPPRAKVVARYHCTYITDTQAAWQQAVGLGTRVGRGQFPPALLSHTRGTGNAVAGSSDG